MKGLFFNIAFLLICVSINAATTNTSSAGNWSDNGNWDNNSPGSNDDANVNHDMNIDQNINVGEGDYIINSPITDAAGASAYTLTIGGSGSDKGNFDVNANATFEGALTVNAHGILTVRSGDTLVVGDATFANGSTVDIQSGGVLIINGDLTNNNNSTGITFDGTVIVNGDVSAGNGSIIDGTGSLSATGSITTGGSGSIFGSTDDCTPGPCSTSSGQPLPIELASFGCHSQENGILIEWTTASEINNSHFTIERSGDLNDIIEIVRIDGAGNSQNMIDYQYLDQMIESKGTYYYRLKQTDYDGKYKHSRWLSVSYEKELSTVVFPNPCTDFVTVNLENEADVISMDLFDASGRMVKSWNYSKSSSVVLEMNEFRSGTYLLRTVADGIVTKHNISKIK